MATPTKKPRRQTLLDRAVALLAKLVWVLGAFPLLVAQNLVAALIQGVAFFLPPKKMRGAGQAKPAAKVDQRTEWRGRALALGLTVALMWALAWRPSPAVHLRDVVTIPLPQPDPSFHPGPDPFAQLAPLPPPPPEPAPEPNPEPTPAAPDPSASDPPVLPVAPPVPKCQRTAQTLDVPVNWRDYNGNVAGDLHADLLIDPQALAVAIDQYGLPDDYRTVWSVAQAAQKYRQRGVRVVQEGGSPYLEVDYVEMVRRGRTELTCVTAEIARAVLAQTPDDLRVRLGTWASFVQAIHYPADHKTPIPERRQLSTGTQVDTLGFRVPLETLRLQEGDCDSKTTLFAALMSAQHGPHVILATGEGHQFGGVELQPKKGEKYFEKDGRTFVMAEFTAPWPLGRIDPESERFLERGMLETLVTE